jgi:hypothetical protein
VSASPQPRSSRRSGGITQNKIHILAALARDILGQGSFARALTRRDLDYLLAEV